MKPLTCKFLCRNIIFSIAIFTLIFCSTQSDEGLETINILELKQSDINISEIADDIEYIPLANDTLLAYIMKVIYSEGEYFVKDNKSKFLRFNERGELLNQIGKRGQGPGEYRYVSDFEIYPETRNVYVTGGKLNQIMIYSPDGKFKSSINITAKYTSAFGISGNNFVLFYMDGAQHNKENLEIRDMDGNLIKSYPNKYEFERGRAVVGFTGECLMYSLENKLHFKEIFSDTIFYLDGYEIIPKMILNSSDRRFTPELRSQIIRELSSDPGGSSEGIIRSVIQNNLFETQNFLFYSYGYDKKTRMLIYNRSTRKGVEIEGKTGIKNDLDGGPYIQLKMKKDDNTIFSWIDAYELKAWVSTEDFKNSTPKFPEKKKALKKLADSLNENDNPVLILVKLRE